ncbi:MAG TPA: glutamate racemase [bacterium]|nr:glutamate racemase [bacterium]
MDLPIGIFDSGLGGLTVLREIEKALPSEDLIYVGDTARVPYGIKSAETVTRYSREICDFLVSRGVKAIVVACNTSSALALESIRPLYSIPLLGVIEPGAQAAAAATRRQSIGVIGTEGTVKSQSYPQAIRRRLPEAKVESRACPLFVPLVEEGWARHEITRQVAEVYLSPWKDQGLDTLILGCTHYPILKPLLQEVLGPEVSLVDSAQETAKALKLLLEEKGLLGAGPGPGSRRFFTTDAPQKMVELASRFLGHEIPSAELARLGSD